MAEYRQNANWNEEDHPRDNDGKFTSSNGSSHSSGSETQKKDSASSGSVKLKIDTPEAQELHAAIKSGKRFTYEELMEHPTVKEQQEKIQRGKKARLETPYLTQDEANQKASEFLKNAKSAPKQFRADIITGLPGAGKSTAVVNKLKEDYGSFEFDNDEIKKILDGYDEYGADFVHKDSKTVQEAALPAFKKGGEFNGANIAVPIVGSKTEGLQTWVDDLKEAGYEVHMHHVEISNEESINRAVARAIETGRYVPLGIIKKYGDEPKVAYDEMKKNQYGGDKVIYES